MAYYLHIIKAAAIKYDIIGQAKLLSSCFLLIQIFYYERNKIMKVYISADIEGVTGVTNWDETELYHAAHSAAAAQMRHAAPQFQRALMKSS